MGRKGKHIFSQKSHGKLRQKRGNFSGRFPTFVLKKNALNHAVRYVFIIICRGRSQHDPRDTQGITKTDAAAQGIRH